MICVDDDTIEGSVPSVVPFFGVSNYDATGWRDVAVVVPYNLLEIYGDKQTCKKYLPLIKSVLDLQIETSENHLWLKAFYNDWLNIDAQCDEVVFATLHNIIMFETAIKLMDILGEDSSMYREFIDKVRAEFISQFVYADGSIKQGTQTVYALAYATKLIDEDSARKHLKLEFDKKNNHIHSGFLGIRYILPVLCDLGLTDLAYELLCNTSYPSWGYSIVNGATTIWERWDSYTVKDGFQDPIMNSFNHYSLGSCGEWFYEYVLGIKPKQIGYKQAIVRPYVDRTGRVNSVSGSFESVNGKISVSWEKVESGYVCKVNKPQSLPVEFVFENVTKIVQDGVERNDFDASAVDTTVYFN
jgi:alpha-L-rhamnosidase